MTVKHSVDRPGKRSMLKRRQVGAAVVSRPRKDVAPALNVYWQVLLIV